MKYLKDKTVLLAVSIIVLYILLVMAVLTVTGCGDNLPPTPTYPNPIAIKPTPPNPPSVSNLSKRTLAVLICDDIQYMYCINSAWCVEPNKQYHESDLNAYWECIDTLRTGLQCEYATGYNSWQQCEADILTNVKCGGKLPESCNSVIVVQ